MDTSEHRTLLESAYEPPSRSVRQVRLEMRLMACSLRLDTTSGVEPRKFVQRDTPEGERWMLKVEAKDSTTREAETRPRAIYVPDDIMDDVQARIERKNIAPDEQLFACDKKTIYRDVKRSAENAAIRTGNEDFEKLSPHDLRRYFATHLLFRHQVDAEVVRVLGGWKSDEAMFEYLVLPDDVLFSRLGEAGLLGTSYDKLHQRDHVEKITATANRLAELLADAESDEVETVTANMADVFEDIDAIAVGPKDRSASPSTPDHSNENQFSLSRFNTDETGITAPPAAAKMAYLVSLVLVSWSQTLAPIA